MSNTNTTEKEEVVPTAKEVNSEDIIEIPWEEVKEIFQMREALNEMQEYFANMCLNFEKNKTTLMNRIFQAETQLYQTAGELRKEKNLDESVNYELKLASAPNEKSYFVKLEE